MDDKKYATFPGWTKKDAEHCIRCRWHGILESRWVTCDYALHESHTRRDCRGGVGCKYFDNGKKERAEQKTGKVGKGMATCDTAVFQALATLIGKPKMQEITGYSRTGLDNCKKNGRINLSAARKLLEETGLDITGGALIHGER